MGNNSTKESRSPPSSNHSHSAGLRSPTSPTAYASHDRHGSSSAIYSSRSGRSSRPDLSLFGIGSSDRDPPAVETRRETRAEREARKLERERAAREKERERSMREEHIDGGFLVTLGTYIGPEDFNKPVVRQLMIERRLAPFWKGLNDHSDSWKEHQLIAAAKGLPIPAADEVPPEDALAAPGAGVDPRSSDLNINHLTVPITSRSQSATSERSMNLSPTHPAFSNTDNLGPPPSSSQIFRSRAKSLVGLTSSSRNSSQTDMARQEIQLPNDPYVNGQRLEVALYKDASECPICFLYYPPYLNRTRCCDQPICSECFVQIKRPDPHPPEHHEPNTNANNNETSNDQQQQSEDYQLVSEPSACPFCVQPEFGVTYEPPPFRRGLAYPHMAYAANPLGNVTSAKSSSTSLNSQGLASPGGPNRRRTTSLSVNSPTVITTDKVRPDWAKKLADARAHAMRRAAAATALHNAAYVLGQSNSSDSRGFSLGRRRRTIFVGGGGGDSPGGGSGHGTPRLTENQSSTGLSTLLAAVDNHGGAPRGREQEGQGDLFHSRHGSRRNRLEDLEELMMMEAIRLSLAAEEDRKRKEEKEAAKEAKREEKKKAKEAKKNSRKSGFFGIASGAGSQEFEGVGSAAASASPSGKGKAVDRTGLNPVGDASATNNALNSKDDAQRHLEQSRANINQLPVEGSGNLNVSFGQIAEPGSHRSALRHLSNASSSASSLAESVSDSLHQNDGFGASASSFEASPNASGLSLTSNNDQGYSSETGTEPMFNFRSLAAVIGTEEDQKKDGSRRASNGAVRIEDITDHHSAAGDTATTATPPTSDSAATTTTSNQDDTTTGSINTSSSGAGAAYLFPSEEVSRPGSSGTNGLDQSVTTIKPSSESIKGNAQGAPKSDDIKIEALPQTDSPDHDRFDQKHYGDVSIIDSSTSTHQPTQ